MSTAGGYRDAGVNLDLAERAKRRIQEAVSGTRTALSVGIPGAFGGMVRVPEGMHSPVLVMSTDGVGTKVLVAAAAGIYDTVGEDLVNHSINDILVHGARPIAFMDYIAGSDLTVDQIAGLVDGIARGCRAHEMTLAGGETAQMPGLYQPGHYDLAGTIIGVVEEEEALHGDRIAPGDILLGYASNGLHTNGYSLARRILFDKCDLQTSDVLDVTGRTVAEELLQVHRSYASCINPVIEQIHGLAHITGGGIAGNLVRILPEGVRAVVDSASWELPPFFRFLQEAGNVPTDEMRNVFNVGVGMIAVLPPDRVTAVQSAAVAGGVLAWVMGEVVRGDNAVDFSAG
ncbi:MAG: phosphoribosylformylglycinamidine cyclo-ligase [Gemmatimonadales bacterium]